MEVEPMGLMIVVGQARDSLVLWLLLLVALAMTLWECRERGYRLKVTLWWVSFVAITHVVGYIVLRLVRPPTKTQK